MVGIYYEKKKKNNATFNISNCVSLKLCVASSYQNCFKSPWNEKGVLYHDSSQKPLHYSLARNTATNQLLHLTHLPILCLFNLAE